jgi:outer membrane receptor protein involved in Fe transport
VSATWFDVAYKDRIDQPVRQNTSAALTDPTVASFVRRINPTTNPQDLALITALLADPATSTAQGSFPPEMYGAIVDARYVNTGRLDVSGLDLTGTYGADVASGRLNVGANLTYMARYRQTLTPTSAGLDRVGQIGFPAKFRGRVTAEWTRDLLTVGGALNRTSAFHDFAGVRIGSLTTVDFQARIAAPEGTWGEGATVTLNVRNLFDKAPPFYDNAAGFAFDTAQGDLIGRFISVQLTKRW